MSFEERRALAPLVHQRVPAAAIAAQLDGHYSAIYREIRRNCWHDREASQTEVFSTKNFDS
nr:helix-turn-helix domain-containing protein [Haematobacter missouriensis]